MQRGTAADALLDAGREVVAAVGSGRDRSGPNAAGQGETLVVGTLLVLAVTAAPILVVALVGYVVTAARDPDSPMTGFDDWIAIGTAGARGTALLVGVTLPVAAALGVSGLLEVEAGSIAPGAAPGPGLGVGIVVLAVATWHVAAVGIAAAVAGSEWSVARGVRFGWSADGGRLSLALAGLAGGVGAVGFGLTAIPVIGPVVAAAVCAVGIAVAGRLVGRAVATADPPGGSAERETGEDRLAVPSDGPEGVRHGPLDRGTGNHDNEAEGGPARAAATRRRPRRGRP